MSDRHGFGLTKHLGVAITVWSDTGEFTARTRDGAESRRLFGRLIGVEPRSLQVMA